MSIHSAYNYKRNRNKLVANLINIIEGITSDGQINKQEIVFLDTWLLESQELSENYYVKCIRNKINSVLAKGVIGEEELQDLKIVLSEVQQGLIDTPNIDLFSVDSDKHLLEGLCKGLISDYHINDDEIRYLNWFLTSNAALKNNYPGKHLYSVVKDILSDGVITNEERDLLLKELISLTGSDISEGVVDGYSTTSPIDVVSYLDFAGKKVCLTGKFLCGTRSQCEADIAKAGGIIVDSVTQALDVLVIGAMSSKDWKFQSFGRKIEKAIELRDNKGFPLTIISEEQWQSFIQE